MDKRLLKTAFWLIPTLYGIVVYVLLLMSVSNPEKWLEDEAFVAFVLPAFIFAPIGGFAALIHCLRYQKQPRKFLPILFFLPLGFFYYFAHLEKSSYK